MWFDSVVEVMFKVTLEYQITVNKEASLIQNYSQGGLKVRIYYTNITALSFKNISAICTVWQKVSDHLTITHVLIKYCISNIAYNPFAQEHQ